MTPLELAADVARRLDRVGIPYVIGGSLASALVGEPRRLRWFEDGGQVSDRQWRDIVSVLRTQAGRLDDEYLDSTARQVGLADLLKRARRSAQE